jgi:hypothetical protein
MLNLISKNSVFAFIATLLIFSLMSPVFAANFYDNEITGFYRFDVYSDSNKIRLKSSLPGEQFGTTIAKGDFNNDGINDLVVGSPFYSEEGNNWVGRTSVFYGNKDFQTGYRNLQKLPPDSVFVGEYKNDQLGSSLAVSDLNGDGVDDLIMSAYHARSFDLEERTGRVYVFLGNKEGFPSLTDLSKDPSDLLIIGKNGENNLGIAMTGGDFNGDDQDDLAITSLGVTHGDLQGTGKVNVLLSYPALFNVAHRKHDLEKKPLKWTIYGQQTFDYFGATLTSGDINGDDKDDLLISSYFTDSGRKKDVGSVYVFNGFHDYPTSLAVKALDIDTPDFQIIGEDENDWLGFSSTCADLDKDGFDDIILGAFPYAKEEKNGKVYVVYGENSFGGEDVYQVSKLSTLKFYGEEDGSAFGSSVATGDFNGDKNLDLVVGAPGLRGEEITKSGKVYVFYGNLPRNGVENLNNSPPDILIEGINPNDWFGGNVLALDINGDRISDVVSSAMYSDYNTASNTGEVDVIFGKKRPLGEFQRFVKFSQNSIARGDFIKHVVEVFGLEAKKGFFMKQCKKELEFCLFNFSAQSRFDDIRFEPNIILYPDVYPAYRNYEYINLATMLGLMHGYMDDPKSPFRPENKVTRIQALKIILGASELLDWKYKFELAEELGGKDKIPTQLTVFGDIDPGKGHMWWYPRYVNYAYLTGIIDFNQNFRPDAPITQSEMDRIIERTLNLIDS